MVYGALTAFVAAPATISGPVLYRHPKNTVLDLNSIITISGGTPPYTTAWYDKYGNPVFDPTNVIPPIGGNQYTVVAFDQSECVSKSKRITVYVSPLKESDDIVTGLNNSSALLTYPNPVENNVQLIATFTEPTNFVTIKILDLLGNEIYRSQQNVGFDIEMNLDMSNYSAGVYMLVVESANDIVVKKIVKQ
jgi:hypothetical protein